MAIDLATSTAVGVLALFAAAAPTSAGVTCTPTLTTEACADEINQLCYDTAYAGSMKPVDRDGLLIKVNSAATKIQQGKYNPDADQKLQDYGSKLDALDGAAKRKITADDYALLAGDLNAAEYCISLQP